MSSSGWRFWIDRGGTFTDFVARSPDGRLLTHKLLSENPGRYDDAVLAGIREMLGLGATAPIPPGSITELRIGTTVATNALLERKGARVLLVVNRGFADLLRIGTQARPRLFDLAINLPSMLYERVVEIPGRVGADGAEIEPLDETAAAAAFAQARADGLTACAIVLMHAWAWPAHEQRLAALARAAGFDEVSESHVVSPLLRIVPRGDTTVADAYLSPVLRRYVAGIAAALPGARVRFMQSSGGLADAARFRGKDAILSGPAGGIVGAARTAGAAGFERIIGFDMGGTSTDVALYAGVFDRRSETEIAGVRLRVPMMAIHTVAAGGGSVLQFDGGRFRVGPESAGADPGPACYRRGGPLTVTDANLLLGRIQARHFPAIFGAAGDAPLDRDAVAEQFAALCRDVAAATGGAADPRDVAEGFLRIAVANMAHAIKEVSIRQGHDPADFALVCFGGAGGQHACLVAAELGMRTVFLHPFAGLLSAYGMGLADQLVMREQAVETPFDATALPALRRRATVLAAAAAVELRRQGGAGRIRLRRRLRLRYAGTDAALDIAFADAPAMQAAFTAAHRSRFGFATAERGLIADTIVVEAIAAGEPPAEASIAPRADAAPVAIERVWLRSVGADRLADVFDRAALAAGDRIVGPALIREPHATIVVDAGWEAELTARNHLLLHRRSGGAEVPQGAAERREDAGRADPVLLELFNGMFTHVATQAGVVLQNTALSVNIKERLDFSCAIFDAEGALIANAPHIPVHLGAMGESVRSVLRSRRGRLRPGDVIALNNPYNGGTHLPDVTVITPVFDPDGREIRCFLANRGHHVDIGGITPGSTPPAARQLVEEGVVIDDFLLLRGGIFDEAGFRALLAEAPYPARNPDVNVADVKAQVAANAAGAREIAGVIARHGWERVAAYMRHVLDHAEARMRDLLGRLADGAFADRLDDGSPLHVSVTIDRGQRRARIDFSGTGAQHPNSFNAPPAITRACVLYVFRCLLGEEIPLNEGCLRLLDIQVPAGSFLSPRPGAAVVAGNTEISQAVCNALLGALGALAASQGTMNNLLFGDATRQYYETICGGTGAGPGFAGTSAVQSHMTNTRITDPELLELRYPVRLEQFAIRPGSGGAGRWRGGDGAIRRLRFLAPMQAVLLASRRSVAPFGLAGGGDGAPGRQWVEQANGRRDNLTGTEAVALARGDCLTIETPGGGGYGPPGAAPTDEAAGPDRAAASGDVDHDGLRNHAGHTESRDGVDHDGAGGGVDRRAVRGGVDHGAAVGGILPGASVAGSHPTAV